MSPAGGVPLVKGIWFGAGPPLAGTPEKGALCSIFNYNTCQRLTAKLCVAASSGGKRPVEETALHGTKALLTNLEVSIESVCEVLLVSLRPLTTASRGSENRYVKSRKQDPLDRYIHMDEPGIRRNLG